MNKTVLILTGVALTAGAAYLVFKPKGTNQNLVLDDSLTQTNSFASTHELEGAYIQVAGMPTVYKVINGTPNPISSPTELDALLRRDFGSTDRSVISLLLRAEFNQKFPDNSLSGIPLG